MTSSHHPNITFGKQGSAILLAEAGWNAINENRHLLSLARIQEPISEGMKTALDECNQEFDC